jgi:hypothetical protein
MAAAFHLLAQDRVSDSDRAVSTDAALLCFAHDNVADFVCGPSPARHAVRDTRDGATALDPAAIFRPRGLDDAGN